MARDGVEWLVIDDVETEGTGPVGARVSDLAGDTVTPPLLEVTDLTVEFRLPTGTIRVSDNLTYAIQPGEILGVVGESGSGKTVGALALVGLLPRPNAKVVGGSVRLDGRELLGLRRRELRHVRGKEVAMIFQDPLTSLNPVFTIERQLIDAVVAHGGVSERIARGRAWDLLGAVGVPDASQRAHQYPHQWSGGMRQRALIAMAMANRPRLIIADEPTTALDVTVQAQVMDTLKVAQSDTGAAMMLITHDLAQVAEIADRIMVLYAGRIVEQGPVAQILNEPRHPYTRGLLRSVPRIDDSDRRLEPIPGSPPNLTRLSPGCAFEPRCGVSRGRSLCREQRPLLTTVRAHGHQAACHFPDEWQAQPIKTADAVTHRAETHNPSGATEAAVVIQARQIRKSYDLPRTGFRAPGNIRAVDDVSLVIRRGETLGLVGESGCGKSTLAWLLAGLAQPDSGSIEVHGEEITAHGRREMRVVRRRLQILFQDPLASLDPKMLVDDIVREPLVIHKVGAPDDQDRRVRELLDLVGLDVGHAERYPHELSGGQRQRVAIARSLALDTDLLILDEPVSALDVSIQAQIIRLLQDLQLELGLSLLFISHDLAVIHALAHRVAVMYLGRIVETGERDEIYESPAHPYTQALLATVPRLDPAEADPAPRLLLDGEASTTPDGGCRFRSRCWKAQSICAEIDPVLVTVTGTTREYACHFPSI